MIPQIFYAFSLITLVAGHGFVQSINVDGQDYPGFDPNTDPYQSPVPERIMRKIPNDGPVRDMTSTDLACNTGGQAGSSLSAPVKAGGTIVWKWNQWLSDHLGPVNTYMASCNGKCTDVNLDNTKLNWFKIDEKTFDPNGTGSLGEGKGRWGTEDLSANGNKWTSTIPAKVPSGEYLVRHEAVALHSSPAQPYPACIQVEVKDGGSDAPSGDEVVPIPGPAVYNDYKWPIVWNNIGDFKAPGPAIAAIARGDADPASDSGGSTSTTAPAGASMTTAAASGPTTYATYAATTPAQTGTLAPTSSGSTSPSSAPASTAGSSCTIRRGSTMGARRMKRRHKSLRH